MVFSSFSYFTAFGMMDEPRSAFIQFHGGKEGEQREITGFRDGEGGFRVESAREKGR
jgi:hypothetical protein